MAPRIKSKPGRTTPSTPSKKAQMFRKMALALEGTIEKEHMNHPDFRVNGKVFATLSHPNEEWGMVKLTPEDQAHFVSETPKVFKPCNGAWGRNGCTNVDLETVTKEQLAAAMKAAWSRLQQPSKP